MATWHLSQLEDALARRGWHYTELPGRYGISAVWELRRSRDERVLYLDFDGMDADGELLPLEEAWGCTVRSDYRLHLSFERPGMRHVWVESLSRFLDALESAPTGAGDDEEPPAGRPGRRR